MELFEELASVANISVDVLLSALAKDHAKRHEFLAFLKEEGATPEVITNVEIGIVYLGDPKFRKKLNDYVFEKTYIKG